MTDLPAETVARLLEAATARGMGPVALFVHDGFVRSPVSGHLAAAGPMYRLVPLNDHNTATLARALAWAMGNPCRAAWMEHRYGGRWALEMSGGTCRGWLIEEPVTEPEALAHAIRAWVEAQQ